MYIVCTYACWRFARKTKQYGRQNTNHILSYLIWSKVLRGEKTHFAHTEGSPPASVPAEHRSHGSPRQRQREDLGKKKHIWHILNGACPPTYPPNTAPIAALVDASERTWVDVDANGYDERTSGSGCRPSGCVPYNTRDDEPWSNSRWSCKGEILDSSDEDDGCCIWYTFEEPQDIEEVSIAFDRGTERTRCLDVFSNGKKIDTINSSGKTSDFEWFNIYTDETKELRFCLCDPKWNEDVWLSITEVRRCSLFNELGIRLQDIDAFVRHLSAHGMRIRR